MVEQLEAKKHDLQMIDSMHGDREGVADDNLYCEKLTAELMAGKNELHSSKPEVEQLLTEKRSAEFQVEELRAEIALLQVKLRRQDWQETRWAMGWQ